MSALPLLLTEAQQHPLVEQKSTWDAAQNADQARLAEAYNEKLNSNVLRDVQYVSRLESQQWQECLESSQNKLTAHKETISTKEAELQQLLVNKALADGQQGKLQQKVSTLTLSLTNTQQQQLLDSQQHYPTPNNNANDWRSNKAPWMPCKMQLKQCKLMKKRQK
jgi:hypothetical protein